MSQSSPMARRLCALAVTGFASSAVLFATAAPASANTNFNGSCEASESCIWQGDIYEIAAWDYESTDSNLSNNYYKTTGAKVDNNSGGLSSKAGSCTAVWGNNYGAVGNSTRVLKIVVGGPAKTLRGTDEDSISSHLWQC